MKKIKGLLSFWAPLEVTIDGCKTLLLVRGDKLATNKSLSSLTNTPTVSFWNKLLFRVHGVKLGLS